MDLHKSKSLLVPKTSYGPLHCRFLDPDKPKYVGLKYEHAQYDEEQPTSSRINRKMQCKEIYLQKQKTRLNVDEVI